MFILGAENMQKSPVICHVSVFLKGEIARVSATYLTATYYLTYRNTGQDALYVKC